MKDTTSREQILKKVRNASLQLAENPYFEVDLESNIYPEVEDDLEIIFAQQLGLAGGHFIYCQNYDELKENIIRLVSGQNWEDIFSKSENINRLLDNINIPNHNKIDNYSSVKVSITECEALISRLGSVLVSSEDNFGRIQNFIPETHVVIANINQVVNNVQDAINLIEKKYNKRFPSLLTMITGPSRTADIEKTLVMGAHGPMSLIVFLTEQDFLKQ